MITPELIAYIKEEFSKGKKRAEIHDILISGGGWTEYDLSEAFREITPMQDIAPAVPIESISPFVSAPFPAPSGERPEDVVRATSLTPSSEPVKFTALSQSEPLVKPPNPIAFKERAAPEAIPRFLKFLTILVIVGGLGVAWWFYGSQIMNSSEEKNEKTPAGNANYQVFGNKDDLVFFSVAPGDKVSGKVKVSGTVKGGYFFEANIVLNILDAGKNMLRSGHATASGDWMTAGPVSFETTLDFSSLPTGPAFVQIHNDNASGDPKYDKFILIPVVIE
ncbi:MAG TPA: Gmad2 immunoglobulin-like domain-containing protein [Candidatus Paceibacterota bacterium]